MTLKLPANLPAAVILRIALGILLPLFVVGFIAEDVLEKERFAFESPALLWVHAHAGAGLTKLSIFLNTFGGPEVMGAVLILIPALLYWQKRREQAAFALFSLGGAAAVGLGLKYVFNRVRPELWPRLIQEHGPSFPSGHSTMAAALATFAVLMLWHTRWRWLAVTLGGLYALLVGYSRLVLGVHYPTDVLAGWMTGMGVVLTVYQVLGQRWPRLAPGRRTEVEPLLQD